MNRSTAVKIGSVVAVAAGVSLAARYGLMEAEAMARECAPGGAGALCGLRNALPQLFIDARLGWASLIAGLVAFGAGSRHAAWAGLVWGVAGLVLYSFDYAAVGALLSLLVLARPQVGRGEGRGRHAEAGHQP